MSSLPHPGPAVQRECRPGRWADLQEGIGPPPRVGVLAHQRPGGLGERQQVAQVEGDGSEAQLGLQGADERGRGRPERH
jgi:hypothetical protein